MAEQEYFKLPIPEGFTKQQLADVVAWANGYQEEVQEWQLDQVFDGDPADFDALVTNKQINIKEEIFDQENGSVRIVYDLLATISNPKTKYEFGLSIAAKAVGYVVKDAFRKYADFQAQQQLQVLDDITAE